MDSHKVKNMQFLRNANRAAIIKRLATQETVSRIELSSQLGLSKMAVSNIVSEMIEEHLITEVGSVPLKNGKATSSGRRPTALALVPNSINGIAVWITRYQLHCLAIEINGQIFCHLCQEIPEDADNQFISDSLRAMITRILAVNPDMNFVGIGIASIGPLDIQKKKLLAPPNFCRISNLDLGAVLENAFPYRVFLDNDMNGIAMAEQLYGIGKGLNDLVYIGIGTGVGSGIIANGKILHGNGGFAGELGHISIDPSGEYCSCGQRGCLELYTRMASLLKKCGLSSLKELRQKLSSNPVPELIAENMREYQKAVEKAFVTIANLFDPELIIVGDQMLPFLTPMLPSIEAYMNTHMFHHGSRDIRVVPSSFDTRAPLVGAGAILFQRVFSGEISLRANE